MPARSGVVMLKKYPLFIDPNKLVIELFSADKKEN